MPIQKIRGKYRWGNQGTLYPTKSGALRQMRAIKASQARRSK